MAGLLLAIVALFAQVAAATPLPAAPQGAGHGLATTVLGIAVPICGEGHGQAGQGPIGGDHNHLLTCARCLCCHAPALMPAAGPKLPLCTSVVYAPQVMPPPSTAPPPRLAARPPPRAPPILTA